jgi:hypothetical protein
MIYSPEAQRVPEEVAGGSHERLVRCGAHQRGPGVVGGLAVELRERLPDVAAQVATQGTAPSVVEPAARLPCGQFSVSDRMWLE